MGRAGEAPRRGRADRAMHADRPLRDAGDDPQHARSRARAAGAPVKVGIDSLAGKRCLITGAASGIGRSTAIAAAGRGAELFLTDRNGEGLKRVAAEIRDEGGIVSHFAALDLVDHDAVVAYAAEVHAIAPSMDVVMN